VVILKSLPQVNWNFTALRFRFSQNWPFLRVAPSNFAAHTDVLCSRVSWIYYSTSLVIWLAGKPYLKNRAFNCIFSFSSVFVLREKLKI
jgi:hypothetical protein